MSDTIQSELESATVQIMLDISDISDKFKKIGSKELTAMTTTVLESSKKPVLIKKILDLEGKINNFQSLITKYSLQYMLKKEDPETKKIKEIVDVSSETNKPIETQKESEQESDNLTKDTIDVKKATKKKVDKPVQLKEEPVQPKEEPVDVKKKVDKPVQPKEEPVQPKEEPVQPKEKPVDVKKAPKKKPDEKKDTIVQPDMQPGVQIVKEDISQNIESDDKVPLHVGRKKIPKQIKTLVWNEYIGCEFPMGRCYCCKKEKIDNRNFHCGHVIADSKGGDLTIKNLRPICAPCNSSMGTNSMNEFTKTFFGWEV